MTNCVPAPPMRTGAAPPPAAVHSACLSSGDLLSLDPVEFDVRLMGFLGDPARRKRKPLRRGATVDLDSVLSYTPKPSRRRQPARKKAGAAAADQAAAAAAEAAAAALGGSSQPSSASGAEHGDEYEALTALLPDLVTNEALLDEVYSAAWVPQAKRQQQDDGMAWLEAQDS